MQFRALHRAIEDFEFAAAAAGTGTRIGDDDCGQVARTGLGLQTTGDINGILVVGHGRDDDVGRGVAQRLGGRVGTIRCHQLITPFVKLTRGRRDVVAVTDEQNICCRFHALPNHPFLVFQRYRASCLGRMVVNAVFAGHIAS